MGEVVAPLSFFCIFSFQFIHESNSKMRKTLSQQLQQWDGIHTEDLIKLYQAKAQDPLFFDTLIELCLHETMLQKASTWLIKHHYDQRQQLEDAAILKLLSACDHLEHWEAKLHILQIIPSFELKEQSIPLISSFIKSAFDEEKKFVRAAAYPAFFAMTKVLPDLQQELKQRCEKAMEVESASIKSKVRKILKQLH